MTVKTFKALESLQTNLNMGEASKGGEKVIVPAGKARARFVGYVETGKHTQKAGQFAGKESDKVQAIFELSGKGFEPREVNGEKIPFRITFYLTITRNGLSDKSGLYKLFNTMNYNKSATHMAQLLGETYFIRVSHDKGSDGVVRANAGNATDGFKVFPPYLESEDEEGNVVSKKVKVDEPISPYRLFLWDNPDQEMWDSLFIDGDNNFFQNAIKEANNFVGSPAELLAGGAVLEEVEEVDEEEEEEEPAPKKVAKKAAKKPVEEDEDIDLDDID